MREMKESGIGRIGQIPSTWDIQRIKYLFRSGKGLPITKADLIDNGLPVISYGQIHAKNNSGTDIKDDLLRYVNTYFQKNYSQCKVNQYDFVFADTSEDYDGIGNCVYKRDRDLLYAGYHAIILKSLYKHDNRYFAYLFITDAWRKQIRETASGVKVFSLPQQSLLNAYVILPTQLEQKRISDFLDTKCSEIDSLAADIQAQIYTLEQYKRSVITEAVTKGLDKNVPMKDSGIDCFDQIPKAWKMKRIKNLFRSGKGLSITKSNLTDNGLPVVSYGQIHAKSNSGTDIKENLLRYVDILYRKAYPQCKVNEFDFIFADTSEDYDGIGNCVYKRDNSLLYAGYHAIILKSKKKIDNRYLAYLFKTDAWRKQLRETASGVKVYSVSQQSLLNAYVILPNSEERTQIADFLDKKCSEIDTIIALKKEQIAVLSDYKKSLIYEYVTGKKEVPNE